MPYDQSAHPAIAPRKQLRALAALAADAFATLAFATLALAASGLPAWASLGGGLESLTADRVQMKAQQQARDSASPLFTMHEDTLPGGTRVRQYVSGNGVVFAVAWSGPFKPDLRQLLGTYFDVMIAQQQQNIHAGQPRTQVREKDLVIESGGRMRNFFGRAYLPSQIPAGLNLDDIQ